ncbi:MAG: PKD domain-containing protein [Bacteroidota bacterium]
MKRLFASSLQGILVALLMLTVSLASRAQTCPVNIDFETGDFSGWTCYTGYVSGVGNQNIISLTQASGPVANQHTMYSSIPGNGVDEYGGFPVNCPNGSGHSIRLGNNTGGGEAEGISYEFTIPAGEDLYNLIYHYAVVFQDPNHLEFQQPRMEIEITNVTDNTVISCSSFTFYPFGSPLPGFEVSPNPGSNTPVYYKNWSAVSINLDGHAGKRIKLFFKTADCTFRRHFGYAYIDVNSECSGEFVGATFCRDDSMVLVNAPHGYQSYTWFDSSFSQTLGSSQVLRLAPPPPPGTRVAVVLVPYNGYGCLDTLYASLVDTLNLKANAGKDTISCNHDPVPIGVPPKPGVVYQWSPATGLTNAAISNPLASPDITTVYILKINSPGGGCVEYDTVTVKASNLNNSLQFLGKEEFCIGSGDSAVFIVPNADSIQWYRNDQKIIGANSTVYRVTQTGTYYATLKSAEGCNLKTIAKNINISSVPVAGIAVAKPNQCLVGNLFTFANTSTNAVGSMRYAWTLGDGTTDTTFNVLHKYTTAGVYRVSLKVNSSSVCADSSVFVVSVFPNAVANFTAPIVCINLPAQVVNNTVEPGGTRVNYNWVLGDGQASTDRTPPSQVYTTGGTYTYTLSVNTDQCPTPLSIMKHNVVVETPKPGTRYPEAGAVINLPVTLQARPIGTSVVWNPPVNLDNPTIFKPVFKGAADRLYTLKITSAAGCETTDTQFVKIYKQVEVFVPTAFTPNNDGKNDFLRPVLIGIKEVRSFRIFNRWGNILFDTKNDRPGWDGNYKGVQQQTQTVIWIFEGIGADGLTYSRKGMCTLIR